MSATQGEAPSVAPSCLIVEDRADTARWLSEVVAETFPDLRVSRAPTLREARRWLAEAPEASRLRLALVDLGLPDGSGVEIIRILTRDFPDAQAVVATIYDDDAHLFDSLAAGAQGYVLKQEEPETVADCLRRIDRGEPPLSPSIARRILDRLRPPPAPKPRDEARLTPREVEVLTLLARGLSGPEAARTIGLQPQTVAGYVKVIYQKLHVSSRAEAVLAAVERGLI